MFTAFVHSENPVLPVHLQSDQSFRCPLRTAFNAVEYVAKKKTFDLTEVMRRLNCESLPESSLGAFWIVKDAKFLHADNEDSDQTARMSLR